MQEINKKLETINYKIAVQKKFDNIMCCLVQHGYIKHLESVKNIAINILIFDRDVKYMFTNLHPIRIDDNLDNSTQEMSIIDYVNHIDIRDVDNSHISYDDFIKLLMSQIANYERLTYILTHNNEKIINVMLCLFSRLYNIVITTIDKNLNKRKIDNAIHENKKNIVIYFDNSTVNYYYYLVITC